MSEITGEIVDPDAIEDSGVQLDALAKATPEDQREAVKAVNLGHAKDVREVLPGAEDNEQDRVYMMLCKWWRKADQGTRVEFLNNWIDDDEIAVRYGRI